MAYRPPEENPLTFPDPLAWYAFYTRARHEQRVDLRLRHLGFDTFLPKILVQRQWRDRKKMIEWPLFPGYIFVRGTPYDVRKIVATAGVVSVVRTNGEATPVSVRELENVRRLIEALLASGTVAERVPLQPGTLVRVSDGPFKGVEGLIVEQRNRRRFVVQLTAIGEGLVVVADDRLLEVVPAESQ